MCLHQKVALLLLGGIILSVTTSCVPDIPQRSKQPKEASIFKDIDPDVLAFTSNLPIIIIDTSGKWIRDEPKIPASMKIIYDKSSGRNTLNSRHIDFEGKIGIELRGKTSLRFPKNQYGVETQDAEGNDKAERYTRHFKTP